MAFFNEPKVRKKVSIFKSLSAFKSSLLIELYRNLELKIKL